MIIRLLYETESMRFVEITTGEKKHFELKVMHWAVNEVVEDVLIEKYNIIEDYVSFDILNNETRITHHYDVTLDEKAVLNALKEISAEGLSKQMGELIHHH